MTDIEQLIYATAFCLAVQEGKSGTAAVYRAIEAVAKHREALKMRGVIEALNGLY